VDLTKVVPDLHLEEASRSLLPILPQLQLNLALTQTRRVLKARNWSNAISPKAEVVVVVLIRKGSRLAKEIAHPKSSRLNHPPLLLLLVQSPVKLYPLSRG
jgi:hypothetical protein